VANLSEYLENEKNIDGREIYATPIQDSLKTKKVGILKEFELNRANFDNIEEYDSYEDLIKDLQNRKLDGIIINEGLSNKTLYFTDDISRINTPLEVKSHSFAFQKGNTDYLNSFNDFMKNSDGGKEKFIRLWKSINTGEKAIEEEKKGLTGENGIINAVFRLNNEPYAYKDENGEITGIEILILYNYARENGYGVNLKGANSYDELIECIKNKSADVIGGLLTVKDEYKDILTYSDTTHMSLNFLLVRYENLKESLTWHKPYESPDDLNGQVLGILKDSSMEQLTIDNFPKSKFIDKEDTFELFQALMMNEFDGFLMDEPNGEEYKLKYPNKITYFDKNYFDIEYSFAYPKK
jgi:ABC-type amino acid transport substrate-binding protein